MVVGPTTARIIITVLITLLAIKTTITTIASDLFIMNKVFWVDYNDPKPQQCIQSRYPHHHHHPAVAMTKLKHDRRVVVLAVPLIGISIFLLLDFCNHSMSRICNKPKRKEAMW